MIEEELMIEVNLAPPPVEIPSNSSSKKRWAVMQIGGARTYAFGRESFLEYVVRASDPPMDVFSFTFEQDSSKNCTVDDLSLQHLQQDSTILYLDAHMPQTRQFSDGRSHDRFVRQQMTHLKLIQLYAAKYDIQYDYLFITRPDQVYARPLNTKALEAHFDRNPKQIYSPKCCKFGGICDRVMAGSFKSLERMIESSEEWYEQAKLRVFEAGARDRLEYNRMTHFDLPRASFAFGALRVRHLDGVCHFAGKPFNATWPESSCLTDHRTNYHKVDLLVHVSRPEACRALQENDCVDMKR